MNPVRLARRTLLTGAGVGLAAAIAACGRRTPAESAKEEAPLPPYEGPLVDPATIAGNFVWQQRVSAVHGKRTGAFDAVLQKDGDELLVVGLTPFHTRGFSLRQRGTEYAFEKYVPFDLPFSPEAVLIDIHRAFFFELEGPFPTEGTRHASFAHEQIIDTFSAGHLVSRQFSRVSGTSGRLLVTYVRPGYAPLAPPRLTTLENEPYGYRLEVETIDTAPLE